VLDILEAEEAAVFGIVARLGGDGDVLVGMGVESGVLIGRFGGWGLLVGGVGVGCEEADEGYYYAGNLRERVGLHGQLDYHLR
jgi:hypothetical protein